MKTFRLNNLMQHLMLLGLCVGPLMTVNTCIANTDQQACAFLNHKFTFKIETTLAIAEARSRDCIFNHVLLVGTIQTTDTSGINTSQLEVQHIGKLQSIKLLENIQPSTKTEVISRSTISNT